MTLIKDETLVGIASRRYDSQRVPQTLMNSEGKRVVLLPLEGCEILKVTTEVTFKSDENKIDLSFHILFSPYSQQTDVIQPGVRGAV